MPSSRRLARSTIASCARIVSRSAVQGVHQGPKRLVRRSARAREPLHETCRHVQRLGGCRAEVYVNRQQRLGLLDPAPERRDDGRDRQNRPVAIQSALNRGQSCGGGLQGVTAVAQLGGIGNGSVDVPADFADRIDGGPGLQREAGQIERKETGKHKGYGQRRPSQPPVRPHTGGRRRSAAGRARRRHGGRGRRGWCEGGSPGRTRGIDAGCTAGLSPPTCGTNHDLARSPAEDR